MSSPGIREGLARVLASSFGDNPDGQADVQGNDHRWEDYLSVVDGALAVLEGDGVLVRIGRPEGYEGVHPRLVVEDAIREVWTDYEVLSR